MIKIIKEEKNFQIIYEEINSMILPQCIQLENDTYSSNDFFEECNVNEIVNELLQKHIDEYQQCEINDLDESESEEKNKINEKKKLIFL